jgi:hypothetical protein
MTTQNPPPKVLDASKYSGSDTIGPLYLRAIPGTDIQGEPNRGELVIQTAFFAAVM